MKTLGGYRSVFNRIIILIVAVSCFSLLLNKHEAAHAAGYLTDSVIQAMTGSNSPHGGYANSTNKCKACHAVHQASGSYKLLRATSVTTQCDYCHRVTTGIIGTKKKIDGTKTEGHTIGFIGSAPNDSDPPFTVTGPNGLQCNSCHSPHGANTTLFSGAASSKLLKKDPDPGEARFWTAPATGGYESTWCSDCHSANYGTSGMAKTVGGVTVYGHGAMKSNPLQHRLGFNVSCTECHPAPLFPALPGKECWFCHKSSDYPHSQAGTDSVDMLKNSYGGTNLDDICNDCHVANTLP